MKITAPFTLGQSVRKCRGYATTYPKIFHQVLLLGVLSLFGLLDPPLWAHGLIQDPPARNWFCGALTKPDQVVNGTAVYPVCGNAFNAPGMDANAGYNFMSVLTHTQGYGSMGARANVCGYNSETWKGGPTVWDQPIDWPTNRMASGPKTFTWNIAWGPHFSDTQEFRYWITKPSFIYQVGKPLSFADFESQPFCALTYSDATPAANPAVIPDPANATFKTRCTLPDRSGRHVIYAEWGRNYYTYERFHSCVDALFDGVSPASPVNALISTIPTVAELAGNGSMRLDAGQSLGNGLRYQWSIESPQSAVYRLDHASEMVATLHYADPPAAGSVKLRLTVTDGVSTASDILTLTHKPTGGSAWSDLGLLSALAQPLNVGDALALRTVTQSGLDTLWPTQPVTVRSVGDWPLQLAQAINSQNGPVRIGVLNLQGEILPGEDVAASRVYATSGTGIVSAFLKVIPASSPVPGANVSSVIASASPWYHEAQVRISHAQPITSLSVKITLKKTAGWSLNGLYNTVGGQIRQTKASTASALVYQFDLLPAQTLNPGQARIFAAQANGSGKVRPVAGDDYSVTYTMGGVTRTIRGRF